MECLLKMNLVVGSSCSSFLFVFILWTNVMVQYKNKLNDSIDSIDSID